MRRCDHFPELRNVNLNDSVFIEQIQKTNARFRVSQRCHVSDIPGCVGVTVNNSGSNAYLKRTVSKSWLIAPSATNRITVSIDLRRVGRSDRSTHHLPQHPAHTCHTKPEKGAARPKFFPQAI